MEEPRFFSGGGEVNKLNLGLGIVEEPSGYISAIVAQNG